MTPRLLLLAAALLPLSAAAQQGEVGQLRLAPADIAALPAHDAGAGTSGVTGIRTRILSGDPTKPGLYTIALTVPANTRIAPHRHRDDRTATIVSGTWYFGYGVADGAFKPLPPGSFYVEPADVVHFAHTGRDPVTLYITGIGPTDTRYVEATAAP
jgi:quercetin dioxygenase-like cupin family protein